MSSQDDDPATMSIGEVARRTGVTVPTLRAWERRYGLLVPVRTAGGTAATARKMCGGSWRCPTRPPRLGGRGGRTPGRRPALLPPSPGRSMSSVIGCGVPWSRRCGTSPPRPKPLDRLASHRPQARPRPPPGAAGLRIVRHLGQDGDGPAATPDRRRGRAARLGAAGDGPPGDPGLLYITSAREATEILAAAVHRLGGSTTPARQADSWALPIDLSFGDGEPILPVAEPLSLARMQLEQVLPGLVEDARRAVQLLRRSEDLGG